MLSGMAAFYNYCGLSSISLPYILTPKVKPILSVLILYITFV